MDPMAPPNHKPALWDLEPEAARLRFRGFCYEEAVGSLDSLENQACVSHTGILFQSWYPRFCWSGIRAEKVQLWYEEQVYRTEEALTQQRSLARKN